MSTTKIILLFFIALLFSCGGDDESATTPVVEIPEEAIYYFTGEVDGENVELFYTATNNVGSSNVTGASNLNNVCTIDYGTLMIDLNETPPGFEIGLLNYYDGLCWEEDDVFLSLFSPAELEYAMGIDQNDEKTAKVGLVLESGYYLSDLGGQSGAEFEITNVTESPIINFTIDVEGTFNCTVYNQDDPTQSIQIKNGRFKMPIQDY